MSATSYGTCRSTTTSRPTACCRSRRRSTTSFGSSGRHGIYRNLITREVWADDKSKDQKYEISNITVDSPTEAPDSFDDDHRASRTASATRASRSRSATPTTRSPAREATYVIKYDVRGALRHFDDHSELYWDATGNGWDARRSRKVTVNVDCPAGRSACRPASRGRAVPRPSASRRRSLAARATFTAGELPHGQAAHHRGGHQGRVRSTTTPRSWSTRPASSSASASTVPGLVIAGLVTLAAVLGGVLYRQAAATDEPVRRDAAGHLPAERHERGGGQGRPEGEPDPGRVLPTADPGRRGRPADRREGEHDRDRGHPDRPRRSRRRADRQHRRRAEGRAASIPRLRPHPTSRS